MTFEEFEKCIDELKKNTDYIEKLAKLNVNIFEELTLETMVVDLIAKLIGDKYEWLSWWVWEKDFGTREDLEAFESDSQTLIPTTTAQDIWNLIKRNVEEEK